MEQIWLVGPLCYATYQISIKALGLVVSDKKIFSLHSMYKPM